MTDLIKKCNRCPHSSEKTIIRVWERYNCTTGESEETHIFTLEYTNEWDMHMQNNTEDIADLAIEWLQDEENFDNQDGEWDVWDYTYFRKRVNSDEFDTIIIREIKDTTKIFCSVSKQYIEQNNNEDSKSNKDIDYKCPLKNE